MPSSCPIKRNFGNALPTTADFIAFFEENSKKSPKEQAQLSTIVNDILEDMHTPHDGQLVHWGEGEHALIKNLDDFADLMNALQKWDPLYNQEFQIILLWNLTMTKGLTHKSYWDTWVTTTETLEKVCLYNRAAYPILRERIAPLVITKGSQTEIRTAIQAYGSAINARIVQIKATPLTTSEPSSGGGGAAAERTNEPSSGGGGAAAERTNEPSSGDSGATTECTQEIMRWYIVQSHLDQIEPEERHHFLCCKMEVLPCIGDNPRVKNRFPASRGAATAPHSAFAWTDEKGYVEDTRRAPIQDTAAYDPDIPPQITIEYEKGGATYITVLGGEEPRQSVPKCSFEFR